MTTGPKSLGAAQAVPATTAPEPRRPRRLAAGGQRGHWCAGCRACSRGWAGNLDTAAREGVGRDAVACHVGSGRHHRDLLCQAGLPKTAAPPPQRTSRRGKEVLSRSMGMKVASIAPPSAESGTHEDARKSGGVGVQFHTAASGSPLDDGHQSNQKNLICFCRIGVEGSLKGLFSGGRPFICRYLPTSPARP